MTPPAVHGQLPQDLAQAPAQGLAPAHGLTQNPAGPAVSWRKAALIAAAGVPVGLLWWVLAPTGLNLLSGNPALRSGGHTEGWLPRDLVLAGLFLLAGCITGAIAAGSKRPGPDGPDVVLAVAAAAGGALAAWGTGVVSGLWWGLAEDTAANASIAFSLRSMAVLAIWPAATALALFLDAIFAKPAPNTAVHEPGGGARKMEA